MFSFVRNCQLSSKMALPYCFPATMKESSYYSGYLSAIGIVKFWILAILMGTWWYLMVVYSSNALMTNEVEYHFICVFAMCIAPSVRCLFSTCPIFKFSLFSHCWLGKFPYIFYIHMLYHICVFQIISLSLSLDFHPFSNLFCSVDFNFDK